MAARDAPVLMTQQQAADYLGVSLERLRAEVSKGRMTYVRVGERRKFTEADLLAWIDRRKATCPSTAGKTPPSGGTRSRSKVLDFAEARKFRPGQTKSGSRFR